MVYFGLRGSRLSVLVSLVAATAFMLQGMQDLRAFLQSGANIGKQDTIKLS